MFCSIVGEKREHRMWYLENKITLITQRLVGMPLAMAALCTKKISASEKMKVTLHSFKNNEAQNTRIW